MCAGGKWSNRSFKTKENTAQLGEWGYFPCNCGQARSFAYIGGGRFQDDCGRSILALKLWKSSIYSGVCVCVCVKHILPTSGTKKKKQQLELENFVFLFALYLMIIDNTADSDLLRKKQNKTLWNVLAHLLLRKWNTYGKEEEEKTMTDGRQTTLCDGHTWPQLFLHLGCCCPLVSFV